MIKKTILLQAVAFIFLAGTAFAEPNMHEGKWEISVKSVMTHQGGMQMPAPPMTFSQCITKKDLIPQKQEPGQECKITDKSVSGDTVKWKMTCKSMGMVMDGDGKVTYSGDSFNGTMNMTTNDPQAGKIQFKQDMSGKRIGNCN